MLSAIDVTYTVSGAALLHRVTLEVRPGEVLALLGENGAGKSTLLKLLSGDCTPRSGQVSMNQRPLHLWSMRERARTRAVLPQDTRVAFGFTALEVVLLGRYPFCDGISTRRDLDIARAALARTGAAHVEQRLVPTLSGGENARVQIARVLAQVWTENEAAGPRYLLLDEPTASLDLAHQHAALELIREQAQRQGLGVLVVLHDLNLAARYADRIVLLKQGSLITAGTPTAVLTPERIANCFGIDAVVASHPTRGCPLVVAA
jgi:heme transport system ATP-binding protein